MEDLVRVDIIITKAEAQRLLDVIEVGNVCEVGKEDAAYEAIDDLHTELWEALEPGSYGFQNRLVISPAAFPLYQPVK